ncbi:MAG: BamA/TamA family outer membrane protein [Bacteroidetes bacterium]|nr:BamA/TamA family outer membrane protein [Bacteroidota bacterium]
MILFVMASCSSTRRLQEGQSLLVKNKVEIKNPSRAISSNDLQSLVQQRPNDRFLGIVPFKLWFNSIFKKAGERPVVLDQSLISESKDQMNRYLNNVGFYDSEIDHKITQNKSGKKKKVIYKVNLSEPYRLKNINLSIEDDSISSIIVADQKNSMLEEGGLFNSFKLDNERSRISNTLRDKGYFGFSKDYVYYEADSTIGDRKVDLTLRIKNVKQSDSPQNAEPVYTHHKVYYINNVVIHPDHNLLMSDTLYNDTLVETYTNTESSHINKYKFIYLPPLKIRPKVISRSMFIDTDRKYNATDASQTYRKLNELRIYKYVDISFKESNQQSSSDSRKGYLDCTINLRRNPVNSYSVELQGTNSGGDLGIASYFVYQNKNLFRGAEVLNVRLKGALEAQESGYNAETTQQQKWWLFNTFEAGIDASLYIPKFLAPISDDIFSRYFRPKTTFGVGYNIQNRLEYDRIITNATFGYEWSQNNFVKHILYPADINLIKVNTTPEFDSTLANESERFRNQYTDHLILGLRYSYILSTQEINKIKNFFYFRGDFEAAGNLLDLAINASNQEKNQEGYYTAFGIRYAQFLKLSADFRYYIMLDKKHSVAFRGFAGIAVPYGNSIDIPYEKGFFGGGANGMRAWRLRYLGPGSYVKPPERSDIERIGDIMLETNLEYRIPIYRVFTGAFFFDMGNIWLLRDNETFPGGKFYADKFLSQLAMDAGIGIRLDFNYFIFRIDVAQRIKDPALPEKERLVFQSGDSWFKPVVNLGIGYPF